MELVCTMVDLRGSEHLTVGKSYEVLNVEEIDDVTYYHILGDGFADLRVRLQGMHSSFVVSKPFEKPTRVGVEKPPAASILEAGLGHMKDRAKTYDAEGGERSMAKTVEAFNALTGRDLTETEGWLMMVCLKLARANQGGFRMDSFEDGAAYMALMGECAALMESKES